MDPNTRAMILGAAGGASTAPIYVEDVFSTWLYTGNGSTQTITNGIDLSGKGGLIWHKLRNSIGLGHLLQDTNRGITQVIKTQSTEGQSQADSTIPSVSSTGFTDNGGWDSATNIVTWTFRKAAKFFDVVTYTGTGVARTIAHNLGSVPGCIIVKRTDTTGDWQVYHRSLANTEYMVLNTTAAKATGTTRWNSTTPTSTDFSLGTDVTVNASGGTYVAYLFAHDAGGFGDTGADNVISCGSFTTDGSGNATVTLGWEPQWLLVKPTAGAVAWSLCDTMRGFVVGSSRSAVDDKTLLANSSNAEGTDALGFPTATGFEFYSSASSQNNIYIAIRRGPMKTPTDATKVFLASTVTIDSVITTGFPVDLSLNNPRTGTAITYALDRLRGTRAASSVYLTTTSTNTEVSAAAGLGFDNNTQITNVNNWLTQAVYWSFRRAPGFFDVVAYTGNSTANRQINHQLAVKPQLIIVKPRNASAYDWGVYAEPITSTKNLILNTNAAAVTSSNLWNNTEPTATVFTVDGPGGNNIVNGGWTYIAYLFASCPGVSKVGSYTGTGTTLQVNCGFTNGARFVLIKRTDSTGDWYVWDTARGIIAANDPYILLNSTAAEVTNTDYIDPYSAGFEISSTAPAAINASGGSFIFLAVA